MAEIGFAGLGNMGLPMARNLSEAGHRVVGYDLSPEACAAAYGAGLTVADSLYDCADQADVLITMLPSGKHMRSVWQECWLERAQTGAVMLDCSTIDVQTARDMSNLACEKGFDLLDAPVSGGVAGAAAGTLTFMVGGTAQALDAARPYLTIMGQNIFHAGAAGAGQAAKTCNNMMLAIQMISVAEGFKLAEKLGLEAEKLFEISATASAQCWSLTSYCPVPGPVPSAPSNNGYKPGFSAAMMLKDLDLAALCGARTPMGMTARQMYQVMCEASTDHGAGIDFSAIIKALD